jgi:hypothetical protein
LIAGNKTTQESIIRVVRFARDEIVIKCTADKDEFLNVIISSSQFLNIFIPSELVLFRSKIKNIDPEGEVTLEAPKEIAQIDRRKYVRHYPQDETCELIIERKTTSIITEDKKTSHKFRLNELSAGGCSIELKGGEAHLFRDVESFQKITLKYDDFEAECQIEVKALKQVKVGGRPVKKVSLEFTNLSQEQVDQLNDKIFRNLEIDSLFI